MKNRTVWILFGIVMLYAIWSSWDNRTYVNTDTKVVSIRSEDDFEAIVLKNSKPVLVDFWAPWCGPCKRMAEPLDEVATDFEGDAVVAKVNVDQLGALSAKYDVSGIPAFLVFQDGKVAGGTVGAIPKNQLSALLLDVLPQGE